MKRASTYRSKPLILLLVLASALLTACSARAAAQSAGDSPSYSGALNTTYENALDPTSQLALGTLRLEGTPDAVTEGQAADLLLLWQALAGNELQGNAERAAVIKQIEATMTEAQIAAIVTMQLTQQDAQDWTQGQFNRSLPGSGQAPDGQQGSGGTPQGAPSTGTGGQAGRSGQFQNMSPEEQATRRAQFQNVSPEQQATRRAQFGQQASSTGRPSSAAGVLSRGLVGAVIRLLSERSGQAIAQTAAPAATPTATPVQAQASTPTPGQPNAPEPTSTPEPVATATPSPAEKASTTPEPALTATPSPAEEASTTPQPTPAATPSLTPEPAVYVVQAGDSLAAIARAYGVSVEAIVEANDIQDPNLIDVGQALIIPGATRIPTTPSAPVAPNPPSQAAAAASAWSSPGLEQLPDKDPGPPFTIQVSANRASQDPLVAKSETYQVTGIVRNNGDQTYAVSAIHVTFFDASGFRGSYFKFPGRGQTGGEWIWHGVTEADFPCLLLAPGEECPFSVQITAQDMASFLIHPDAEPTGRESAAVALSNVRLIDDGAGYVRLTGTATNTNPFKVKDVTVAGTLLNASGQIVQVGSTYVLQENIEPGASVSFDLRIAKEAYTGYHLYAQAERDWQ